jgi:hypothetical protein
MIYSGLSRGSTHIAHKMTLTPWSRVIFEKPLVTQLLKNFPTFCGNRRFIIISQVPTTGPYPESDQPSPYYAILFLSISLLPSTFL